MTSHEGMVTEALEAIAPKLRRHRLVYVQLGTQFDNLRDDFVRGLGGVRMNASEPLAATMLSFPDKQLLVIDNLELLSTASESVRLAPLREAVNGYLDASIDVCLISRIPKIAYPRVLGSSLLDDSASHYMKLPRKNNTYVTFAEILESAQSESINVFNTIVEELGFEVLAALDWALYELDAGRDQFLSLLDPREIEALRGACLVHVDEQGAPTLGFPKMFSELKTAVAEIIGSSAEPQQALGEVVEKIWFIEHRIRRNIRERAVGMHGNKWRGQVLFGDMPERCIDRAQKDTYPSANTIRQLRDPLEWLTLSELIELIERPEYECLGLSRVFWSKFAAEVLPIRNRLAHMRHLRSNDLTVVQSWAMHLAASLPS